jgi:hypothetical protein
MTASIRRIILACLLAGLFIPVTAGIAQETQDIEGSKDHPLVSRYPGSVIDAYRTAEFDELTLPPGVSNDGVPAKSRHVEGKITRISYAAPVHRSILEIYRNYESALRRAGFEVLFACVNNEGCGSTGPTLWSAQGGEDWGWSAGQRYLSAKLSRPEGDDYVSLHIGQWSNAD